MAKSSEVLPEWVKQAGGEVIWRKWIERKVEACQRRAKKWADKRQDKRPRPRGKEWRAAIYKAIRDSEGRGCYSHLPLSLNRGDERNETHWDWPSLDHVSSPAKAEVALETRLVNDMKTIMTVEEFHAVIGHLASVLGIPVKELPINWQCGRHFAIEEKPTEEPPLPM